MPLSQYGVAEWIEKEFHQSNPGISDENEILKDSEDPDIDYNQLIRPWKSRLGLLYVDNMKPELDLSIIFLTILNMYSRPNALRSLSKLLKEIHAPEDVIRVSKRQDVLVPFPPPGSNMIVVSR